MTSAAACGGACTCSACSITRPRSRPGARHSATGARACGNAARASPAARPRRTGPDRMADPNVLRASYVAPVAGAAALPPDTLGYLVFGDAPLPDDPRAFRIALEPLGGAPRAELWRGSAAATSGVTDGITWAHDGAHLLGRLELDESASGGIERAADSAYRRVLEFTRECGFPHLVRIWNYFDAINAGDGDDERYRRFCVG